MSRIFSSPLARHLSIALLVKALALTALWHACVAPQKKHVDERGMAGRIAAPTEVFQSSKEDSHDDRSDRR